MQRGFQARSSPYLHTLARAEFAESSDPTKDAGEIAGAVTAIDDLAPNDEKAWVTTLPRLKEDVAMLVENEAIKKLVAARPDLNLVLLAMLEIRTSFQQGEDLEGRARPAKRNRTEGSTYEGE